MQKILDEINKQIEIAVTNQASWYGLNEQYAQYWLGQKHALKLVRRTILDQEVAMADSFLSEAQVHAINLITED